LTSPVALLIKTLFLLAKAKKTSLACFPFANKNKVFITKQAKVVRTPALQGKKK